MKTNQEHFSQSGSGLVYVLIAVVLFAALSFTLMRSTDTNEAESLSDDKAELYANQLIGYAAQAKNVVDQMLMTGITDPDDLRFDLPGTAGFNTDVINQIYHPEGGGLIPGKLPSEAITNTAASADPGWYLQFTQTGWTPSNDGDLTLTAHKIHQNVCKKLNQKISGSSVIPLMGDEIVDVLIDAALIFSVGRCPGCEGYASLCIEDTTGSYGFYSILAPQ